MITQIFVNWLWSLKSSLKKYSTNIVHSHNTNRITYTMIQILQICIKTFTGNCPNTAKDGRYVTPYLITYSHSIIPKITSPDDDRIKIGTTIDDRKENGRDISTIVSTTWRENVVDAAHKTGRTEFYEDIYMAAIFYRALDAGSRSPVPQWRRRPPMNQSAAFKDFFLIPWIR